MARLAVRSVSCTIASGVFVFTNPTVMVGAGLNTETATHSPFDKSINGVGVSSSEKPSI